MSGLPLKVFKVAVGKDRNAAEVFKEIWYWAEKSATKFNRPWTALSRERIMVGTELSLDQVKRGLVKLRSLGFVSSEQHLFNGKNVNHFTVTEAGCWALSNAVKAVLQAPLKESVDPPHKWGDGPPPEWCTDAPLITTTSSSFTSTSSTGVPVGPQEDFSPKNEEAGKVEKMKMEEALIAGKGKAAAIIHKPNTASDLAQTWKTFVAEKEGVMVGLKAKELGQLASLVDLWPKAQSKTILIDVLTHWVAFTKKVEADVGEKMTPAKPHCGFLLKHASIAAIFAHALHLSAKPDGQEASKAKSVAKQVQSISLDEPPVSYEEAMSIMKGT